MLFVYIVVAVWFSWFITPLGKLHVTDEPSYPFAVRPHCFMC
jgi:hypothetical protein